MKPHLPLPSVDFSATAPPSPLEAEPSGGVRVGPDHRFPLVRVRLTFREGGSKRCQARHDLRQGRGNDLPLPFSSTSGWPELIVSGQGRREAVCSKNPFEPFSQIHGASGERSGRDMAVATLPQAVMCSVAFCGCFTAVLRMLLPRDGLDAGNVASRRSWRLTMLLPSLPSSLPNTSSRSRWCPELGIGSS